MQHTFNIQTFIKRNDKQIQREFKIDTKKVERNKHFTNDMLINLMKN